MKQLETIIQKLKNDQYFAVTITNRETYKTVCTNRMASQMVEEAGSVEKYFNKIVEEGHTEIAINPRRKNGTSFKDDGQPVKLSLRPKGEHSYEATPVVSNSPALNQPSSGQNPIFGLMAGMNGLDMAYRYQDYPKVTTENDRLKLENENLKKEVASLEKEIMQRDFSDNKANGNKELVSELLGALPTVMGMLSQSKSAQGGLNGSSDTETTETLSDAKKHLIEALKNQSDGIVYYLEAVLTGMTKNEPFSIELLKLLQTNNLIQT
ncbi:hypothetical protein Q763_01460 [Flavobacterium beibuense F44-8]|uniref:Uncharacterized protein n=1 Tax=Flavobacterium beibuense F44-8 TaxID=1406840 RepID=A0A0A2LVP2_9FLAO|nr:hypothetical protein [Flavobacterium beibuense]KGO84437.1 hypothetical protein Q763_01460 [Flavobacterium beibuense F44-8]